MECICSLTPWTLGPLGPPASEERVEKNMGNGYINGKVVKIKEK
jgi:hypothetical protein